MAETVNTYTLEQMKRDNQELLWENRIQTLAVLVAFFFGIVTLRDISKKLGKWKLKTKY